MWRNRSGNPPRCQGAGVRTNETRISTQVHACQRGQCEHRFERGQVVVGQIQGFQCDKGIQTRQRADPGVGANQAFQFADTGHALITNGLCDAVPERRVRDVVVGERFGGRVDGLLVEGHLIAAAAGQQSGQQEQQEAGWPLHGNLRICDLYSSGRGDAGARIPAATGRGAQGAPGFAIRWVQGARAGVRAPFAACS